MTNEDFIRIATQELQQHGSLDRAEAHGRARLLLDAITGTRFSHLMAPDKQLEPWQVQRSRQWLADALRGRPIPYILNRAAFYGLDFMVDERVLIPRPETELLVETALDGLQNCREPRVADLGTGSGIIAVSLAKSRPDAQVLALDLSPGALEIARQNAELHGVSIQWLQGDGPWLAPLEDFARFDAIISNPPYIPAREIETLDIGVRDFEPRLALDGGADGLSPYRELAVGSAELLRESGFVALELGAGQFSDVRALFEARGWQVEAARRDLAGIERVLVARLSDR
ncbi:MAG TPA: peptide chain release factor N(5)-glutamine methyltransferase [Abditibacterium sp.]|jgi:release factor glutamine methyltransferase